MGGCQRSQVHMASQGYMGSRKEKARFQYEKTKLAGFVEMSHEWSTAKNASTVITKFRQALLAVPGVTKVQRHPKGSKVQQGNIGNHFQDHNFVVSSEKTGDRWIEFELTRFTHAAGQPDDWNYTVSACFKPPQKHLVAEAWRIPFHDCKPNALLPNVVDMNYRQAIEALDVTDDTGFAMSSEDAGTEDAGGVRASDPEPPVSESRPASPPAPASASAAEVAAMETGVLATPVESAAEVAAMESAQGAEPPVAEAQVLVQQDDKIMIDTEPESVPFIPDYDADSAPRKTVIRTISEKLRGPRSLPSPRDQSLTVPLSVSV